MKRNYLLFFLFTLVCTASSYAEVVLNPEEVETVCKNDLPFVWHGHDYYESGTYYDTISSEEDTTVYVLQLTVYSTLQAGSISMNGNPAIVCRNSQTDYQLIGTSPVGGSGNYLYQWQKSDSTGNNWTDIQGATSMNLPAQQLISHKTHFHRIDKDSMCQASCDTTKEVIIDVYQSPTKPVLAPYTDTVCYNEISNQLSVATPSTGYSSADSVIYKWEYSDDNVTFYSLGSTGLTCTPQSKLTAPKWYRVNAVLASECDSVYSDAIKVNVYDPLYVQVVSGSTTVCHMASASISVSAIGVDGKYSYRWYESSDISILGTLVGTKQTLNTPAKTGGTYYYRCVVTSTHGCGSDTSDVITVITRPQFHAGSISFSGDSVVCPDSVIYNPFASDSPASGGSNSYAYQWQYKNKNDENWTSIPGENQLTLSSFTIETTTFFRRLDIDTVCNETIPSNEKKIDIFIGLSKPKLSQYSSTVCYDSVPTGQLSIIRLSEPESPLDSVTYSWEFTNDLSAGFSPLNEDNTVYSFTDKLTDTTYYRVVATLVSGCGKQISDTVMVCVYNQLRISDISGNDNICYNTSTNLSVTASGVDGLYDYQWYRTSTPNVSSSWDPVGTNNRTYETEAQTSAGTLFYKCQVTSRSGCGTVSSDIKPVNTFAQIVPGTLKQLDTIGYCKGTKVDTLTFDTEPDGYKTIVWQYRKKDSDRWIDLPTVSSKDQYYDLNQVDDSILTDTIYVHAKLNNACGDATTSEIEVRINPLPKKMEINFSSNYVCSNDRVKYYISSNEYKKEWKVVDPDLGSIVGRNNQDTVEIQWTKDSKNASVSLTITDSATGCSTECDTFQTVYEGLDPVKIFRKRGSNILYCKECDTTLYYQWQRYANGGNISNAEDVDYGQGKRYIVVENKNDLNSYTYFLQLTRFPKTDSAQCSSYNEFRGEIDSTAYKRGTNKIYASTCIHDVISIRIENPDKMPTDLAVYSVSGILLYTMSLGDEEYIVEEIPVTLLPGVYFLNVKIGSEVSTIKLMAE